MAYLIPQRVPWLLQPTSYVHGHARQDGQTGLLHPQGHGMRHATSGSKESLYSCTEARMHVFPDAVHAWQMLPESEKRKWCGTTGFPLFP